MQQNYGHPPPHGQPPPQGQPPPPGYGYGPQGAAPDPGLQDLENQSTTWMVVAIAGFFLSFGFITGPLAWIYGSKLRNQYRLRGLLPHGNATAAWIIGIVSTGLYVLAFIGIVMAFLVFAGAVAAAT